MSKRPAGELLDGQTVVQLFNVREGWPSVISLTLATYRNQIRGSVTITVHEVRSTAYLFLLRLLARIGVLDRLPIAGISTGPAIASYTCSGEGIEDNESIELLIDTRQRKRRFWCAIKISVTGAVPGHAPTVWFSSEEERIAGHIGCYVGEEHQGAYGFDARLFYAHPYADTSVPPAILFSPVTQCNLNCIHCISRDTRKSVSRISDAAKNRIRQLCEDGSISFLATDYSGDVLWADHHYGGELDYLISLNIPFHVDTNGVYLTELVATRLSASKIHSLNISLDAARDDTYRRVRKGAPPLPQVLQNIKRAVEIRNAAGATFQISMSFTLMASTLHEWPEFVRMAATVGVSLVVSRHLEAYTADMEHDSLWHAQERYNEVREYVLELGADLGVTVGAPPPFRAVTPRRGHRSCPEPWRSAVILGNGDVAACCVPGMVMGNLNDESLEKIWNGTNFQNLRMSVNSENPPAPCRSCPMYRITENPDSYLIHSSRNERAIFFDSAM